jgi:hypothetical protein
MRKPLGRDAAGDAAPVILDEFANTASAGSMIAFHRHRADLEPGDLKLAEAPALTEADVATVVAEGRADAGLGIATVAYQARLGFVPLVEERYDLAVWRAAYFEAPMQKLLSFARTPASPSAPKPDRLRRLGPRRRALQSP